MWTSGIPAARARFATSSGGPHAVDNTDTLASMQASSWAAAEAVHRGRVAVDRELERGLDLEIPGRRDPRPVRAPSPPPGAGTSMRHRCVTGAALRTIVPATSRRTTG
jgi:hypothetical protein